MNKLPVWASVAYAARCARRVQRMCERHFSEHAGHNKVIELAIDTAEKYASDPMTYFGSSVRANAAADPADDAAQLASEVVEETTRAAAAVARAAQMAAKSAAYGCAYSAFAALYEEARASGDLRPNELESHSRRSLLGARKCRETAASGANSAYQAARLGSSNRGFFGTKVAPAFVEAAIHDFDRIRCAVKNGDVDPIEPAIPPQVFGRL